jgi:hypothetical protein
LDTGSSPNNNVNQENGYPTKLNPCSNHFVGKYETETKGRWQDNIKTNFRKIIFDDMDGNLLSQKRRQMSCSSRETEMRKA